VGQADGTQITDLSVLSPENAIALPRPAARKRLSAPIGSLVRFDVAAVPQSHADGVQDR